MLSRKAWETAGFITIAAALHVSAAAFLIPQEEEAVMAPGPLSPSLSAGGGEIGEMIEKWESQPQAGEAPEQAQPEAPEEAELTQPDIEEPVEVTAPKLQAPTPPEINTSTPNLPEPPDAPKPELPELQSFDPPVIKVDPPLTLVESARPERRPEKPAPEPEPEPQRETRSEPAPAAAAAAPQPQRQAAPASGQGGAGGGQGSGGGGGALSPGQIANLRGQWQGQIQNCVGRPISRVRAGSRSSGQAAVYVNIAPSGAVQAAQLTASTGDPGTDRDIARVAQRIGRCPAAPAGVTESFQATLPITIGR